MSIRIVFDNPKCEYYSGTVISGKVNINWREPRKIRKIAIIFQGEVKTHWTENSNDDTDHYRGKQLLFDHSIILVDGPGNFQHQQGLFSYRFEYLLPRNLPANFEGDYGSVCYTAKAIIDIPWSFDISCKQEFKIIPVVDLNIIPRARHFFHLQTQKTIGLCSGKITMTVTAPRSGFICSEIIPFCVEIKNHSSAEIYQIKIKINKIIGYISTRPKTVRYKSINLVSRKWPIQILPHGGKHTLQTPLRLILTEPSTTDEKLIIQMTYDVVVTCKLRRFYSNFKETCPIIIGNVPMRTVGNDMEPPPPYQA